MTNYNVIKTILNKLDPELVIVELGAYAALCGDPLPKDDYERIKLAIRRIEALRGAISARIK
jgi:hypothetical protein